VPNSLDYSVVLRAELSLGGDVEYTGTVDLATSRGNHQFSRSKSDPVSVPIGIAKVKLSGSKDPTVAKLVDN